MKRDGGKPFDAVTTMRRIRDRLSRRFARMSFAEQKAYLDKRSRAKPPRPRLAKAQKRTA